MVALLSSPLSNSTNHTMLLQIALSILSVISISSYKYLPGAYSIRFYNCVVKYLFINTNLKPESPFKEAIRSNSCCILECDIFGMHKNNVTYSTELDVARTETFLKSFNTYFNLTSGINKKIPFVPLASIQNHFLKEIKPFQSYKLYTKILAWDNKWIWTCTLFTIKEKSKNLADSNTNTNANTNSDSPSIPEYIAPMYYNNERVCCISVGKLVFKENRKTLNPFNDVIKNCNFKVENLDSFNSKASENKKIIADFLNNPTELLKMYKNTV